MKSISTTFETLPAPTADIVLTQDLEMENWPIGGLDTVLQTLQEKYIPNLANINIPGLLNDNTLGSMVVVSSFGTESAVLLHYISGILPHVPVVFLDTGKHFPDTIEYRDLLVELLHLNINNVEPEEGMIASEDPDGQLCSRDPNTCCTVRKTLPLQDALGPYDSWVSGRKRYQGATRAALPVLERDGAKIKINPLAFWRKKDISAYFEKFNLPRHPLEARGFPSIGCAPCTRPASESDNARVGRWAHMPDKTECGIHLSPDGRLVRKVNR